METVIPNTHTYTHTQARARSDRETPTITHPAPRPARTHGPTQTDACRATWTHTDLHMHASSPPSGNQNGGSFAAHMEPRSSWAIPESGCRVGLGHLSQGRVHQPLCGTGTSVPGKGPSAPHPVRTATILHREVSTLN